MAKKKAGGFKEVLLKIVFLGIVLVAAFYAGQKVTEDKELTQKTKDALLEKLQPAEVDTPQNVSKPIKKDTNTPVKPPVSTPEESNQVDEGETEQIPEQPVDISMLPLSVEYGNPIEIGDNMFTYSDIKGLELQTQVALPTDLDCETVTQYLSDSISGYHWWNTCRPIAEKKGVSVYVLVLKDEEYMYQKRYYIPSKQIQATYELETQSAPELENHQDKLAFLRETNATLKEKNEEFAITKVVDTLFGEIITN